jgi:signal transduction histidine kinase
MPAGRLTAPLSDRLLATALFVVVAAPHVVGLVVTPSRPGLPLAIVTTALALAVVGRTRQPVGVWVITTAIAGLLLSVGHPNLTPADALVLLLAPLVALYTMARSNQFRGRLALVGSMVAFAIPMLLADLDWDSERNTLLVMGMLVTAWALGETMRTRAESTAQRLRSEAAAKAEHDRTVAAEERARIARELHDITAHHISVVTLQAGAARMLAESGQTPSVELLSGIETAGRQAMIEIRQALGVIRSSPDGAAPLPGVASIPELARRMGLAGLDVTVDGTPGPLPGGMELTVYRIVQEGLTNVARHSTAHSVEVAFRRAHDTLAVHVTDRGPARDEPPESTGGHGLVGLRERVLRYGGQLNAGPLADGGFRLSVTLPVRVLSLDAP